MAAIIEVKYFNSFILSKTVDSNDKPVWKYSSGATTNPDKNWYVEESRIRGGYNDVSVDYGGKAYLVEKTNEGSLLGNGLIYSGIYNSRTDVNNTNQFPIGEDISRSLDPSNGTIQKLYAEDADLTIFQENKVSKALIDKDAIYSAEGGSITTTSMRVIGQIVPYKGNYGISKNPESFAVYGYRKYFTDKNRNAVLRLSRDGITEISSYGMKDFFRDNLINIDEPVWKGKIVGGFDVHNKSYVVSLQSAKPDVPYKTLAFDEAVKGWTSFYSYDPSFSFNLKNNFFTTNGIKLYLHNFENPDPGAKNKFYGEDFSSSVKFVFNPKASSSKFFKTINYEGSDGWELTNIESSSDTALPIFSRLEGTYDSATPEPNVGAAAKILPFYNAGFVRKENKYHAIIKNNTSMVPGAVLLGKDMTGIKGYFATAEMKTDSTTNPGVKKELFAVSANYEESSY